MATKNQVIALHRAYPHWTDRDIAAELDCDSAYVRATARRNRLVLASARHVKCHRSTIAQMLAEAVDELLSIDARTPAHAVAAAHRKAERARQAYLSRGRGHE